MTTDTHSCSLYCDRPDCIKAQRDQMRDEFAHPQVPLTDDEIEVVYWRWQEKPGADYTDLMRAIERAHGIGEKT